MRLARTSKSVRNLLCVATAAAALTAMAPQASAAFHLWTINEVYSNSSGTLQFIELTDTFGSQNFVGGQAVNVSNVGGTITHPFTLPGVTLPGNTFGRSLLLGTAGIQAAGAPAPDFIIPNGFLFTAGGTINFFGLNSGPYAALPTDGLHSKLWSGGTSINSPTNYAGESGFIVPAPATMALAIAGGLFSVRSRRRVA